MRRCAVCARKSSVVFQDGLTFMIETERFVPRSMVIKLAGKALRSRFE